MDVTIYIDELLVDASTDREDAVAATLRQRLADLLDPQTVNAVATSVSVATVGAGARGTVDRGAAAGTPRNTAGRGLEL